MPSKPKVHKPYRGSKVHIPKRTDNKFYKKACWVKCRDFFLRANPLCKCGKMAVVVHHKQEIKLGGDKLDFDNLESMCSACHNRPIRSVPYHCSN